MTGLRWRNGDVYRIKLGKSRYGYAQLAGRGVACFFDLQSKTPLKLDAIITNDYLFCVWVMKYTINSENWTRLNKKRMPEEVHLDLKFFRQDGLTGELFIYFPGGHEIPATLDEVKDLECAAVWDPHHVEDRLRDHFDGKPNKWFEAMGPKTKEQFEEWKRWIRRRKRTTE